MKKLTFVMLMAMAACSTDLSTDALQVQQISPDRAAQCQPLGQVKGVEYFGITQVQDAKSAQNKLRNNVAEMGGNAFTLTQASSDEDGAYALGEAYRCDKG